MADLKLIFDCAVIGAGASGMMCAGKIAEMCPDMGICLIEKNPVPGKKLLITGKGRCNVTNNCDRDTLLKNTVVNSRFMYSAFTEFSSADTMSFFEGLGVALKTERGNRVFPVSDRSADIVSALKRYTDKPNITHLQGNVSEILTDDGKVTGCVLSDGRHVDAPRIVVATGGKSYPLTGSTGAGYGFAKECGHTVMPLSGAIVPIELEQTDICKRLEGLSLRNTGVRLVRNGKEVYSDFGELVFTYYGVSGPTILSASAHCAVGDKLILDLKPALDEKTLDARLLSDFSVNINRNFSNSLGDLLPSKMIPVIIDISGIPAEEKVNSVTKTQRKALLSALKGLTFTVKGLRPIEEAVITAGGVNVRELDPKTMRSKITDGLWFAGEVIDVHAYTGGFNLQIAFSTAVAAASGVAQYFKEFM